MSKILKWVGIVLGALIGLAVAAVLVMYFMASARVNRTYDVQVQTIPIPSDQAAVARGQHIAESIALCSDCHGPNLGGREFINDPSIGLIYSANLTSGSGGAGASYSDEDWIRSLTHGVDPEGRMLMVMPSQNFRQMSDADLGAVIAYAKSMAPVDGESPEPELSFMAHILFTLGAFGEMAAERIDHQAPRPAAPAPGVTSEYGGYLVTVADCRACHSDNLAGGQAAPSEPWAPNITPGGELIGWSEADFITLMREGVKPSGSSISTAMPYEGYGGMTDDELRAIWMYLSGLEAVEGNPAS